MIKKTGIFLFFLSISFFMNAQTPSGIPSGKTEPLELNLVNIIVYIVLPVLLLIFYLIWRSKKKK